MTNSKMSLGDIQRLIQALGLLMPERGALLNLSSDQLFRQSADILLNDGIGNVTHQNARKVFETLINTAISPIALPCSTAQSEHSLPSAKTGDDAQFVSYSIFANESALCFNASKTKSGFNTVTVDSAKKTGQHVDWKRKVIFQITERELSGLYAILKGYEKSLTFGNHASKTMSMKWQSGGIFFAVTDKGFSSAAAADSGDVFQLTMIVMRQLRLNFPFLTGFEIDRMVHDNVKAVERFQSITKE